jgi:hypothetical protein
MTDDFISATRAAGAQSMVTIPTIGWVAKLDPGRGKLSSFSIANTWLYQQQGFGHDEIVDARSKDL